MYFKLLLLNKHFSNFQDLIIKILFSNKCQTLFFIETFLNIYISHVQNHDVLCGHKVSLIESVKRTM